MLTQNEVKSIQEVAQESDTAKAVFNSWGQRQRLRRKINIDRLKVNLLNGGQRIVDEEFTNTFKRLEDLGIGSIIHGRGKSPNKFELNYNLKDLAKASNGEIVPEEIHELQTKKMQGPKEKSLTGKKKRGRPSKVASSHMMNITFEIPSNVDPRDLSKLFLQVQSLRK